VEDSNLAPRGGKLKNFGIKTSRRLKRKSHERKALKSCARRADAEAKAYQSKESFTQQLEREKQGLYQTRQGEVSPKEIDISPGGGETTREKMRADVIA